jgi:hypothetical protein
VICFDVHLNGRKLCRAGIGKYGTVHVTAGWSSVPPAWRMRKRRRKPTGSVSIGGVTYGPRPPVYENVAWPAEHETFSPGDELLVRCVEAPVADAPSQRHVAGKIPPDDEMEMIRSSLAGHARSLARLKVKGAAEMSRQLRSILKKIPR